MRTTDRGQRYAGDGQRIRFELNPEHAEPSVIEVWVEDEALRVRTVAGPNMALSIEPQVSNDITLRVIA